LEAKAATRGAKPSGSRLERGVREGLRLVKLPHLLGEEDGLAKGGLEWEECQSEAAGGWGRRKLWQGLAGAERTFGELSPLLVPRDQFAIQSALFVVGLGFHLAVGIPFGHGPWSWFWA
jgi:hypothetical protein